VGENGFKRKDNLVQHLRGVHGDRIGKKSGRRPATTRMSPYSSASNAGAGAPTMATGYEQFPQGQQEEPFVYMNQQPVTQEESGSPSVLNACMNQQPVTQEESGSPSVSEEFWEGIESYLW